MSADRQLDPLPPLLGGILVGGASRRMGSAKALLEWAGETFVERIARALAATVPELFLFGSGVEMPATLARYAVVPDAAGASGPLAGLLAAFALRPGAAWLMLTCDQPRLDTRTLSWLIGERRGDRIAVLPRLTAERIEPFPGIYEPRCLPELEALAAAAESAPAARPGRGGSLQPLAGHPDVRIAEVPRRFAGAFLGVNTPAELAVLRRGAGSAGTGRDRDGKRPG